MNPQGNTMQPPAPLARKAERVLMTIAAAYMLSGYYGLYREQKFLYSKFAEKPASHKTRRS